MKKVWQYIKTIAWHIKIAWKALVHKKVCLFQAGETYTDLKWLNFTGNSKQWAIGEFSDGSGYQLGIALPCNKPDEKESQLCFCWQNYKTRDDAEKAAKVMNDGTSWLEAEIKEKLTDSIYKEVYDKMASTIEKEVKEKAIALGRLTDEYIVISQEEYDKLANIEREWEAHNE